MGDVGPSGGFWTEGAERLAAGLEEAEERELGELSLKLGKVEDAAERGRLLAEMEEVRARYREERRALLHSLFSTATDAP